MMCSYEHVGLFSHGTVQEQIIFTWKEYKAIPSRCHCHSERERKASWCSGPRDPESVAIVILNESEESRSSVRNILPSRSK
jgi:hypothetical protein